MQWLNEDKGFSGYLQSLTTPSSPTFHLNVLGSEDSLSVEKEDLSIGKYVCPSKAKEASNRSVTFSDPFMPSFQEATPPPSMSGKKTPESPEPNLNWERNQSNATANKIGTPYGNMPLKDNYFRSPVQYELRVIGLCEQLVQTMQNQLEWSELASYTGVQQELVRVGDLGKKQAWTLTLKIRTQNSGAGTLAKAMLLSMNFVVVSTYRTCCDGLIVTQQLWKSKEAVSYWLAPKFGSRRIYTHENGTQM